MNKYAMGNYTIEELKELVKNHITMANSHTACAERFEKEIAELKTPKIVGGRYVTAPGDGTEYYYIHDDVDVGPVEWHDDQCDFSLLAQGNAFVTEEDATKASLKTQALQALRGCEGAKEFGFVSWSNNYQPAWDYTERRWTTRFLTQREVAAETVYFDTQQHALEAINRLSDEMQEALR